MHQLANPLGPQSTAVVIPKQTRFRTFATEVWQSKGFAVELVDSTDSDQVYGPVGTKFADLTLGYTLDEFLDSSDYSNWDAYRFDEIQVYGALLTSEANIRVHSSIDADDTTVASWQDFRKRPNASTAVVRFNNPMQLIAKWKPFPEYSASSTTVGANQTNNKVGKPGQWFDTRAFQQSFLGLKIHLEGDLFTGVGDPRMTFLARAKIALRAPQ